jgi:hypothetical protein
MQRFICAYDTESETYVFPGLHTDSLMCPECVTKVKTEGDHFVHLSNTLCRYLNGSSEAADLVPIARRALMAYLQTGAVLYISYMCRNESLRRHYKIDTPHNCSTHLKLFDGYRVIFDDDELQRIVLYSGDDPQNWIIIRDSDKPRYYEIHDSPHLFEFCAADVFRMIESGGFIQCLRILDIPDRCENCNLEDDELGAIHTGSGKFCLPAEAVEDEEYKCQSCSEAVEIYKNVFYHIDLTTCRMYTYPTDPQYIRNTLLKVEYALRNRKLTDVYWECGASYFSDFDPHYKLIYQTLIYNEGDTICIDWEQENVRMYNSDGYLKYEFLIRKNHHNVRTHANKLGRFLIEYDVCMGDNKMNVFWDGSYCDDCKKLQSMEHLLKRLPIIEFKGGYYMFQCIFCKKRKEAECLKVENNKHPVCHDCLLKMEPGDLHPYNGNVWLFIDETVV